VSSEPKVYQARYGLTWLVFWSLAGSLAVIAAAVVVPIFLLLKVVFIGLPGLVCIFLIAGVVTRHVAIRADHAGLTLGGEPFHYQKTTWVIPWPDVEQIVIWHQPMTIGQGRIQLKLGTVLTVGLELRPNAALPPSRYLAEKRDLAQLGAPVSHIYGTTRATGGCRLDPKRLTVAIAACAPDVPVINAT
jgi:hypothetical protein